MPPLGTGGRCRTREVRVCGVGGRFTLDVEGVEYVCWGAGLFTGLGAAFNLDGEVCRIGAEVFRLLFLVEDVDWPPLLAARFELRRCTPAIDNDPMKRILVNQTRTATNIGT